MSQIWLMTDEERLSVQVREAILEARIERETLAYSRLSLYEIA
jgi:PIN domain nuclease of toxin-antitoxin system